MLSPNLIGVPMVSNAVEGNLYDLGLRTCDIRNARRPQLDVWINNGWHCSPRNYSSLLCSFNGRSICLDEFPKKSGYPRVAPRSGNSFCPPELRQFLGAARGFSGTIIRETR
jgi:hypothetical protein